MLDKDEANAETLNYSSEIFIESKHKIYPENEEILSADEYKYYE